METFNCRNCSAPIPDKAGEGFPKCPHCGTYNLNPFEQRRIQNEIDLKKAGTPDIVEGDSISAGGDLNIVRVSPGFSGNIAVGRNIFQS